MVSLLNRPEYYNNPYKGEEYTGTNFLGNPNFPQYSALQAGQNYYSALPNYKGKAYGVNTSTIPTQPKGYSSLGQQMNAMNLSMPSSSGKKTTGTKTPPNWRDNLLNYVLSPKGQGMAQGLLEASGYSETPISFGQALAMGLKRGNEAEATAAASKLKSDEFAYKQRQDQVKNWLDWQQILAKDTRTIIEKQMSSLYPNLVPGSPEYAEQAMKILKSSGMNVDFGKQGGWGALETGSADILTGLSKEYRSNFDHANKTISELQTLRTTLMPLNEEDFGRLSPTKLAFAQFLAGMGFPIDTNNTALMESVFAQGGAFVMGQIQLTKGAVSEKEMAYFDMISPSLTKTKDGMLLMISILEHGQKHKQKVFDEYTKFKKTWKQRQAEGASPFDLEAEWNEKLLQLENDSTAPKHIMNNIENIVLKQAYENLPDGVTAMLDPKKDIEFINKQFKQDDGSNRFLSEQFIGFDAEGYPLYMVEDGKSNFIKVRVTGDPEGEN